MGWETLYNSLGRIEKAAFKVQTQLTGHVGGQFSETHPGSGGISSYRSPALTEEEAICCTKCPASEPQVRNVHSLGLENGQNGHS